MRSLLAISLGVFLTGGAASFELSNFVVRHPPLAPVGVTRYMEALREHDGKRIWASYSPAFQEVRVREGDSPAATIAFYDEQGKAPASTRRSMSAVI